MSGPTLPKAADTEQQDFPSQDEVRALRLAYEQLRVEVETLRNKISADRAEDHSSSNVSEAETNPKIGTFDIREVRLPNQPRPSKDSKRICFASPYPAPPGLPVGLTKIDISNPRGVSINSYATGIKNDLFDININVWSDTRLWAAACTWLELGASASDSGFQFGRFSTEEDHGCDQPQQLTSRRITFQRPYSTPPQVVVWLCSFSMGNVKTCRVRTYATDVNMTGFTIHIDTWGDSILCMGAATWIAYPATKPKVFSGSFNTSELRHWNAPQPHNSGYAKFGAGVFTTPPSCCYGDQLTRVRGCFEAHFGFFEYWR